MDLPTTPIKNTQSNEIHPLSVVHSPPILKSDDEIIAMKHDDLEITPMEGYPHGLSAKKRRAAKDESNLEARNNNHPIASPYRTGHSDDANDMSIELGRNGGEENNDTSESNVNLNRTPTSNNSTHSKSDFNPKEIQENLGIDGMSNSPDNVEPMGNSISNDESTNNKIRSRDELALKEDNYSSKKAKLDMVPDLHQSEETARTSSNTGNDLTQDSPKLGTVSPIHIDLLESNPVSSPLRNSESHIGDLDNQHGEQLNHIDGPFDNSHKLTPITHQQSFNYDEIDTSVDIDSISKRNEELNKHIFSLNQRINSMHVMQDKIKIQMKQLHFDNDMINEEKIKLQEQIDNANKGLKDENESIKNELHELKSELSGLQSNQTLLQEKYDQIYNENIKLQNAKDMLTNEVETLQKSLSDSADILEDLSSHNKDLETKLDQTATDKETNENERNELTKELRRIMAQLDGKDNEITSLEEKVKQLIENERTHSKDLIDQVAALNNDKMSLEERVKKNENTYKTEQQYLHDTIDEKEKQITDIKFQITSLNDNKIQIEQELKDRTSELESLKRTFEETNDNATIRTAEVTELNEEIENLKESRSHLENNVTELEDKIQEWKSKYEQEVEKQQKLHIELESIRDKNSITDSSPLTNEDIMNTKEFQELKSENEQLKSQLQNQRDTQLHSNSGLETDIQKEASLVQAYKKQIEEYKRKLEQRESETAKRLRKLSEDLYVQYSSKHEQKVKLLKKNYETKFKGEIDRLTQEKIAYHQEIEQLNNKLALERREKQELIKALEEK